MKRNAVFLTLFILIGTGLSAFSWTDWSLDVSFGIQVNSNLDETAAGKQPSKLLFAPGASLHGDFDGVDGGLYFRPGGWLSWNIEEVYSNGVARPTDEATLSHMKVVGLMLDAPFGYVFRPGSLKLGVQGGLAFYARFPLYTAQEGTGVPAEFWTAYYGGAQFLYLSLASWVSLPVTDSNDLLLGLRIYHPLSNIWTEAPFFHGFQAGLLVSFQFAAGSFSAGRTQN